MELTLIEENKTQIKVSCKELRTDPRLRSIFRGIKPCRENTRYKYYIVDGDLLNRKRR